MKLGFKLFLNSWRFSSLVPSVSLSIHITATLWWSVLFQYPSALPPAFIRLKLVVCKLFLSHQEVKHLQSKKSTTN